MWSRIQGLRAQLVEPAAQRECAGLWQSIRRYFQQLHTSEDYLASRGQIDDVRANLRRICTVLRAEREDRRAIVKHLYGPKLDGFAFPCAYAKTAPFPELSAAMLEFLVEVVEITGLHRDESFSGETLESLVDTFCTLRRSQPSENVNIGLLRMGAVLMAAMSYDPIIATSRVLDRLEKRTVSEALQGLADFILGPVSTSPSAAVLEAVLQALQRIDLTSIPTQTVASALATSFRMVGEGIVTVATIPVGRAAVFSETLCHLRIVDLLVTVAPTRLASLRLESAAERIRALLRGQADKPFQATCAVYSAVLRASTSVVLRRSLAETGCTDDVVGCLLKRAGDVNAHAAASAIGLIATLLLVHPWKALPAFLPTRTTAAAASAQKNHPQKLEYPVLASFVFTTSMDVPPEDIEAHTVDIPNTADEIEDSPLLRILSDRLGEMFNQPSLLTASLALLLQALGACPSPAVWHSITSVLTSIAWQGGDADPANQGEALKLLGEAEACLQAQMDRHKAMRTPLEVVVEA